MAGSRRLIRIASFAGGLVGLCACGQAESDGSSVAQSGGAGTTTLGGASSTGGATTFGGAPVVAGGNTSASGGTSSGGSSGGPTTTIQQTCGEGHGHRVPSIEDAALALVGTFSGRPFALRRDQLSPGSCGVSAAPTFNFSFWIEEEGVSVVVRDCATIVHLPELGVAVPADGELVFRLPSQDGESAPSVGHWTLKQDATATTPAIDIEFTASMLVNPESPAIPCVG